MFLDKKIDVTFLFLVSCFTFSILALIESGIVSKWVSSYERKFFNTTTCQREKENRSPIITLNILVGPLITLAVGVFSALCVLVIEILVVKNRSGKKGLTSNSALSGASNVKPVCLNVCQSIEANPPDA